MLDDTLAIRKRLSCLLRVCVETVVSILFWWFNKGILLLVSTNNHVVWLWDNSTTCSGTAVHFACLWCWEKCCWYNISWQIITHWDTRICWKWYEEMLLYNIRVLLKTVSRDTEHVTNFLNPTQVTSKHKNFCCLCPKWADFVYSLILD